ncbi:MAG: hypothetical protein RIC35_20540 [Marinoscillum sp.]
MKVKLLNLGLILSSLIGYLEWGGGNQMFLIEGEIEIITKLIENPSSAIHAFTLLPLLGQLLLLVTLFQKQPGKLLIFSGLVGIGLLLIFMFVIRLINFNLKILGSTLPFLVLSVLVIREFKRKNIQTNEA